MIQEQCLNYILDKKDSSFIVVNSLNEDFFPEYRNQFRYIKNHLNKYGVICDKETFKDIFPDFEITKVNESPEYLINELYYLYRKNTLITTFNNIKDDMNAGKVEKAFQIFNEAYNNLSKSVSVSCIDLIKDTSRYDRFIEKTQDFNKFYVTTGFKELDDILGGWDRKEELATIVARTNHGKSWVCLKSAVASCQVGLNVGFYSGEMSEDKVGTRLDTILGHIANKSISHGNVNIQNEYKEYLDNELPKIKGTFKVLTPKMLGDYATIDQLKAFVEREHLDILFVDQLSLLRDMRGGKSREERMSNLMKDLKNLQSLKQIPIILVAQQNRTSTEDKMFDSTQIADSDAIGRFSTIVIFIGRDKKDPSHFELYVDKSRDSEKGMTISYSVDLDKGTFIYVPESNAPCIGVGENSYENRYSTSFDEISDEEL